MDPDVPRASRVYDCLLGGGHNFAADRALAEKLEIVQPDAAAVARRNREFLRRVVLFMLDAGVRQFLDLGCGIPTVGNVHEIAQAIAPEARVVYVDYEAVAVAHNQLMLAHNDNADIVEADVTRADDVLDAEPTRRLLDFDQPIGLLAITVGHFIAPDANLHGVFARYRDALPPGSYLALTHFTDDFDGARAEQIVDAMRSSPDSVYPRTRREVLELFTGYELVEPGLVTTSTWRPGDGPASQHDSGRDGLYAGVGRRL